MLPVSVMTVQLNTLGCLFAGLDKIFVFKNRSLHIQQDLKTGFPYNHKP